MGTRRGTVLPSAACLGLSLLLLRSLDSQHPDRIKSAPHTRLDAQGILQSSSELWAPILMHRADASPGKRALDCQLAPQHPPERPTPLPLWGPASARREDRTEIILKGRCCQGICVSPGSSLHSCRGSRGEGQPGLAGRGRPKCWEEGCCIPLPPPLHLCAGPPGSVVASKPRQRPSEPPSSHLGQ